MSRVTRRELDLEEEISKIENISQNLRRELELSTLLNKGALAQNQEFKLRIVELEKENGILSTAENKLTEVEDQMQELERLLSLREAELEEMEGLRRERDDWKGRWERMVQLVQDESGRVADEHARMGYEADSGVQGRRTEPKTPRQGIYQTTASASTSTSTASHPRPTDSSSSYPTRPAPRHTESTTQRAPHVTAEARVPLRATKSGQRDPSPSSAQPHSEGTYGTRRTARPTAQEAEAAAALEARRQANPYRYRYRPSSPKEEIQDQDQDRDQSQGQSSTPETPAVAAAGPSTARSHSKGISRARQHHAESSRVGQAPMAMDISPSPFKHSSTVKKRRRVHETPSDQGDGAGSSGITARDKHDPGRKVDDRAEDPSQIPSTASRDATKHRASSGKKDRTRSMNGTGTVTLATIKVEKHSPEVISDDDGEDDSVAVLLHSNPIQKGKALPTLQAQRHARPHAPSTTAADVLDPLAMM